MLTRRTALKGLVGLLLGALGIRTNKPDKPLRCLDYTCQGEAKTFPPIDTAPREKSEWVADWWHNPEWLEGQDRIVFRLFGDKPMSPRGIVKRHNRLCIWQEGTLLETVPAKRERNHLSAAFFIEEERIEQFRNAWASAPRFIIRSDPKRPATIAAFTTSLTATR